MASAFQMQARAAQLQRTSELAGEAFGFGPEAEPAGASVEPAAPPWRWLAVMCGAGAFLLAIVFLAS